jgi:hypothetical protein
MNEDSLPIIILRPLEGHDGQSKPQDPSPSPVHNRLSRKKLDPRVKLFQEIKAQLRAKREASVKQLVLEQTKVRIRDCWLKRISPSYWQVWKLFQAKAFILSLVRSVIEGYRQFGMAGSLIASKKAPTGFAEKPRPRLPLRMYPGDQLLSVHGSLLLLIFCYVFVYFPLQMAFWEILPEHESQPFSSWNCAVLSYLTVDVCSRFFTAVRDEGLLVDSLGALASRYVSSFFLLDALGSLPFEYFVDIRDRRIMSALLATRMCRIFSTVFSKKAWGNFFRARLKSMITSSKMMKVLETLFFTLLIMHSSSCFFLVLGSTGQASTWLSK